METYTEIYNELGKDHFFVGDGNYVDSTIDELRFESIVAERYAEQFKPKWIPVTEILPEDKPFECYRILVYGTWNDEVIAVYQDKQFYDPQVFDDDGNPTDITNLITHWMYLPDAP